MNKFRKMRIALWLVLICVFISEYGRILVAIPFSIVNVALNGSDAVLPTDITELTQIIYHLNEALLFALIIRKETVPEFISEKFNKKVFLFMGLSFAYAAVFYLITTPEQIDAVPTHYLRTLIFAPISEEIMYRGVLQRTLKGVGGIKFSIICTSIIFAAVHMNFTQTLFTLPLGFLLGYVAEYYSLKCSILVHFAANLISLIYRFKPSLIIILAIIGIIYIIVMIIIKRKAIAAVFKQKAPAGAYKKFFLNVPFILLMITLSICMLGSIMRA